VGVNLSRSQIDKANQKAKKRNLNGRVDFLVGSATELNQISQLKEKAGSFDKSMFLEVWACV
jgi:cyclopropane fatty-acyl-phospholipid synthase-like methyltransferase